MAEGPDMRTPTEATAAEVERRRRQRARSVAIAVVLVGLVVLFYVITIIQMGNQTPGGAS